jgi:predicted amidohydrolase YtcJ
MRGGLPVDLLLYGGRVITLEDDVREAEAVAVLGGRIAAVGSDRELAPLRESARRSIDLDGGVLVPGFVDAHNHLFLNIYLLTLLDCRVALDSPLISVLETVAGRALETPAGNLIRGWGYADYKVRERRYPTRWELDEAAPDNPVVLIHVSGHHAAVNSAALEAFRISAATPDPPGGRIERDSASGEPTGVLHESAMHDLSFAGLVLEFLGMDRDSQLERIEQGGREYLKCGITSVHDASCLPQILKLYQEAERRNRLPVRLYPMPLLDWSRPLLDAGVCTGFGSDRLRVGPIKVMSDGSLSGRTAAVSEPYRNTPGNGMLTMDQDRMNESVREIHEKGFQAAIHAIGDRAVEQVMTAFEQVIPRGSGNPMRHRIEHAGVLDPVLIRRMAERDIVVATQPRFLFEQGDGFLASCGADRIQRVYPFRSLLESGIRVAGSSDCPVVSHEPLLGIRDAVMRRTEAGEVLAPDERLTPEQALRMFTIEAARASFEEDRKGSIRTGKLADLVVLDQDPLSVEPEQIGTVGVRMTLLDGEVVYSRED